MGASRKRLIAVGCSHGIFASDIAVRHVLRFIADFAPGIRIHLGDFLDTTAFRAGAQGTIDETVDLDRDLVAGLGLLQQLGVTHVTLGNHDWRVWRYCEHQSAPVRKAARDIVDAIMRTARDLHCQVYEYHGVWNFVAGSRHALQIGDYVFGHGSLYGENATRDYAERFGNVVHAHTHVPAVSAGRRADRPTAYGVGCLVRPEAMEYAAPRAATMRWGWGIVYGELMGGKRPRLMLQLASIDPRIGVVRV